MIRDFTMVTAVLVAVISLVFGVYKNIEANNAKGFAYDQAYKIMDVIQRAPVSATTKATMLNAALDTISTPPPVIDLSRSSAGPASTPQACSEVQRAECAGFITDLAAANSACSRAKGIGESCIEAQLVQRQILSAACIACY